MRAPPPVEFNSALGRAWRAAVSLLLGASAAVPLAWVLPYLAARRDERAGDPVLQGLLALATAAVVAACAWRGLRAAARRARTLRWDGQDWVLAGRDGAERRGDAALMLDLGPWMLVRFLPQGGMEHATWLPLTAGPDAARWAALRGALWNWRSHAGAAR